MLKNKLLNQPRHAKQLLVLLADAVMGVVAVWVAYSLRLDTLHWPYSEHQWWPYVIAPLLAAPIFWRNGLYRAVFRHSGMAAMRALVLAVSLYAAPNLARVRSGGVSPHGYFRPSVPRAAFSHSASVGSRLPRHAQ